MDRAAGLGVESAFVSAYALPEPGADLPDVAAVDGLVRPYLRHVGVLADVLADSQWFVSADRSGEPLHTQTATLPDLLSEGLLSFEAFYLRLAFVANELGIRGQRVTEIYRDPAGRRRPVGVRLATEATGRFSRRTEEEYRPDPLPPGRRDAPEAKDELEGAGRAQRGGNVSWLKSASLRRRSRQAMPSREEGYP